MLPRFASKTGTEQRLWYADSKNISLPRHQRLPQRSSIALCHLSQTRYDVAVSVQRYRDTRVPEHLAHNLRVDHLCKQQGRAGVPEVVEAYVGQPGLPQQLPCLLAQC